VPERFLLGVLAALLAVIALGTVWAVFVRPVSRAEPVDNGVPEWELGRRIFTGMGRLRIQLAARAGAENGDTVVITVVFPYDDSDRAFVEELAQNISKFRILTSDYFESLPAGSPLLADEQMLKASLISRYNSLLHLGRIDTLYFSEFMIIN
jgi:hypothetical protein